MIGKKIEYAKSLPHSWSVKTVGEIGSYLNGYAFKPTQWGTAGLPIIRIQNLNDWNKPFNYFDGKVPEKYKIRDGDILISWSASLGTYRWNRGDAWLNQHIFKATPNLEELSAEFFYWVMVHGIERIAGNARGSTMKHVTGKEFTNSQIALPPLPEQKKIAHILSTVQRAIEAQERIIQTTTELKKALMHELFTEGLCNEPQKETEIGPVPTSWQTCKVGDVAKIQSGGTPSREVAENWNDGTIPWVKTGEINYCLINDTEEKITPNGLANSAARVFPRGTLLMAMYGQGITRGRVGLLGIEAATNQACASITPTDEKHVSSVFLYYFFEYHYEDLRKLGHGANQRNMNAALIRSFPLTFPRAVEQAAIVAALESLDEKRELHKRKRSQLQDLFRSLLHELMTAKTRVRELELSS